jgi:hypothetical protein
MWCVPPLEDAAFVCDMERVLDVYRRPYDPRRPVVCMDEQPRQLIRETRRPLEARPGDPRRVDYEYVREGVCTVWMFCEPLGGWRDVRVSARRTAADWARQVQALVDDPRYAAAERVTLVCDNLDTHSPASFYRAFAPAEAHRLAARVEVVHTPKHGSWLNVAEIELSILTRQCLSGRIPDPGEVAAEAAAWSSARNAGQTGVDWHFTTDDARVKLKRLYPKVIE